MKPGTLFSPESIYGIETKKTAGAARVLTSPCRYIQGRGTLDYLGQYIGLLPSSHPVVLITEGGKNRFGDMLWQTFDTAGINTEFTIFQGECTHREVNRHVEAIRQNHPHVDSLIAVGGGKCMDAGKCVAYRLDIPTVICPTIASTDAPCSATSIMYSEDGIQVGAECFPSNPELVVVDTDILINAPVRQLVAGMGDGLATFYEARTCFENPMARSMIGGRMTVTAMAIAELCARTILQYGLEAVEAASSRKINDAFEQVVEANTLMSGIGFESGGLSTAHAVAVGLNSITTVHRDYLHGELVGFGLLVQLVLEMKLDEARKIGRFLKQVGLPAHLGQFSLDLSKDEMKLNNAMKFSIETRLADSEPFEVTADRLMEALGKADSLGREIAFASAED